MEEKFEEGVARGMDLGREEGYTVAKQGFDGIVKALKDREQLEKVSTSDFGTQTDSPHTTTTTSHLDASAQASEESEPPPSPSQPQKKSTAPLDWAEDANTLPIIPPSPSLRQPRDLLVLRSSSSSPFSSLQRRLKNRTKKTQQSHCRHSHFYSNSSYSSHHVSFKPLQSYSHTKKYSQLNWECDPCLSDLSRSLKALGWIRAS